MRILWLAAADARGHLMRAHLVKTALARRGARVDVVTTSDDGVRFLAALGTPASVLSSHYGVAFDAWQNMDRRRTEATILRYLVSPSRGLADLRKLDELAAGADLVVNDFHPLLLLAGARARARVVHVYGTTLFDAVAHHFDGHGPAALDPHFCALATALRDRACGRIEHSLAALPAGRLERARRRFVLPTVVAPPGRSRDAVRDALGLAPATRLCAAYLNPHFRDARLADALRAALAARNIALYGVSEGCAARPGFIPYDPRFADAIAAADVLVSAPGMATCTQARAFGTPFVALVTDQPEQRANVAAWGADAPPPVALGLTRTAPDALAAALGDAIDRALRAANARRPRVDPAQGVRATHDRWCDALAWFGRSRRDDGRQDQRPTMEASR